MPRLRNASETVNTLTDGVRKQIRKDLELRTIGAENVTRLFSLEQRTLQRRLKAAGTSYRILLNDTRIGLAKELLSNSDIPIAQLSARLCFCSPANFSKAFKLDTGHTPSEWRRSAVASFGQPKTY